MTLLTPVATSIPFRFPERTLGAFGTELASKVVAAASDIALVVDRGGVVRDLSINAGDLAHSGLDRLRDRPWVDSVTVDSRPKINEMLRDACSGGVSRWREVNHPLDVGTVLIKYFALDAGDDGNVIVIGRDMRADHALQQRLLQVQQSVERDYLKLRQAESRYRLLFQTASEAVLIVDAVGRRIREANPAALRMTDLGESAVNGQPFTSILASESADAAAQLLSGVQGAASPSPLTVKLVSGVDCTLSASLFRQDQAARFLVRLTPHQTGLGTTEPAAQLQAVLERISDGFVVTDPDLRILTVNSAFLDLAQLASAEQATDQVLDRYLGRPQIDVKVMLSQLREHGALRNFATVVRGRYGSTEDVEVSAVAVLDVEPPCFGFSIRSVGRRPKVSTGPIGNDGQRSVEQLTQLIGRVPMKEIVRESTDLIERLCIEAALTLTSNNRASAADVLGLSRQSLYSKLHRYGLGTYDDASN